MNKKLVSVCAGLGLAVLGTLSSATVVSSQASSNSLGPGQRTSFRAAASSGQFRYSVWKTCFTSRYRNAKVNIHPVGTNMSRTYPVSGEQCITYRPNGRTYVITNTGNTSIAISIVPSYR